ncbi:MAG: chemotaxis response regulator protein-glutamate methylesterase, partial [Gammaproteobacteria bacterium]|nr:chemotaxis response regulator protein-glutamate methylesterase [Gammaproteobacteria bacterium]
MKQINVLLVDDSAVIRQVLTSIFEATKDINVIAAVADPIFAMKRMEQQWPDVIVLDVEMPRMDGITFLRKIMSERPTPVVICSTLTDAGAETTMQAVEAGAVEIICKPKVAAKDNLKEQSTELVDAVRAAASANVNKFKLRVRSPAAKASSVKPQAKLTADAIMAKATSAMKQTTQQIVAIGTSTGGTQALESILVELPRVSPGIVIVQHMPEKFTEAFAQRLNGICEIDVKEAENGDRVRPGRALIAPGGKHLLVKRSGAEYLVEVVDGPLVSRHRPSVDVLFRSIAKSAGKNALGIIMTGMGDDGAKGLKEMHEMGSPTIAQDEATSIVYGMPKEAVKLNAVD